MTGTMNSLNIAQDQLKHNLVMGTPESRAKYHNAAKDTEYNFDPKLDKDVITSQRSLVNAEESLGKTFDYSIFNLILHPIQSAHQLVATNIITQRPMPQSSQETTLCQTLVLTMMSWELPTASKLLRTN